MKTTILPLLLAALLQCGCSAVYLDAPLALSSQTGMDSHVERIAPVALNWCDRFIVVIPLIDEESKHMGELLTKAKGLGGTAVVDVQVKETDGLFVAPFYGHSCWEIRGTAARIK